MVNDWSWLKEISLSETGDRGSECDDCHIRSHVFCIRSHESLFRSHERQIRSGRIVCNPLAEWALCFFSSEVSQFLSSVSEVISASSSAIPHWAVKAPVLFLHLWPYVCCLDFDCKVRHFFLNTRCTSITCTIVKSVKKIKGFYTHWEVFCHSAVLPPNWNILINVDKNVANPIRSPLLSILYLTFLALFIYKCWNESARQQFW